MKKINNIARQLRTGMQKTVAPNEEIKKFVDFIATTVGDTKKSSPLELIYLLYTVLNDTMQKENLVQLASSKYTLENVKYSNPRASFPPELAGKKETILESLDYLVRVVETFEDKQFSDKFRELFIIVFGASTLAQI